MTVSPPDAAVAARSFPRRWRALFARAAGDDDAPDVLVRSGAPDLARRAALALGAAADRLQRGGAAPVDDPLAALEAEATRLAAAVESVDPGQWDNDAVALLSAAIDEAATLLRAADRAVTAARGG